VRNPRLALNKVLCDFFERGTWPAQRIISMRADRRQLVDYRGSDLSKQRALTIQWTTDLYEKYLPNPPSPEKWLTQSLKLELAVARLAARGCPVAFVRFPSTDETWELESRYFPKEKYWDCFAARSSAVTVHFRDAPSLAGTDCPDTSHLDFRDAEQFTRNLL